MNLGDLLTPARVLVPLRAASLKEAMLELVDACATDGGIGDMARAREVVRERWPEDLLSFGDLALLPHVRTDAATTLSVAIGVAPTPLVRSNPERKAPRIVVLVLAPPREAARYLQIIAAFGRMLSRPETIAALLAAETPADVLGLPAVARTEIEGPLLVRDIMTTHVVSVAPDTPLVEAAALLVHQHVEALPVVGEANEVIGMLSNRELLRHLVPAYVQRMTTGEFRAVRPGGGAPASPRDLRVRDAMARNIICLGEDQTVADVAQLLLTRDVDRFPVVRRGVLTGFLTRADIVRKLLGPS